MRRSEAASTTARGTCGVSTGIMLLLLLLLALLAVLLLRLRGGGGAAAAASLLEGLREAGRKWTPRGKGRRADDEASIGAQ